MKTTTEKINSVDEYIKSFPKPTQKYLKEIRATIKKEAPDAEEVISYSMPAFKYHGMLVYYAAYEHHIGFYALPSGNAAFKKELANYKMGKGSIQFPLDKAMPLDLIKQIVHFRVKENLEKATLKKKK